MISSFYLAKYNLSIKLAISTVPHRLAEGLSDEREPRKMGLSAQVCFQDRVITLSGNLGSQSKRLSSEGRRAETCSVGRCVATQGLVV